MNKIFVSTAVFALAFSVSAIEKKPQVKAVEKVNKAIGEVDKIISRAGNPVDETCNGACPDKVRSCVEVTDNFCAEMWDKKNKGNMKVFDGEIKAGKSSKSKTSLVVLMDDQALIDALPKFPADMQKTMGDEIAEFDKVLKRERDDKKWATERSLAKLKVSLALQDVVDQRFEKKHAPLLAKDYNKFTIEQKVQYNDEEREAKNEIAIAKYADSANWKRVEKIFPAVKENLLKEIGKLSIPSNRKKILEEKIKSIKLSLPLAKPGVLMADDDCRASEVNAFYTSQTNHFTVCAGFFNGFQSEAALSFVIAHEMGHAIDSEAVARDDNNAQSPTTKILNKFVHSKGPAYKCAEWNEVKKELIKNSETFELVGVDPLEKLYSCLRGESELDPMNKENISNATKVLVKNNISDYTGAFAFSNMAQKWVMKDGVKTLNEMYMRPDKFMMDNYGYDTKDDKNPAAPVEVFTQNFACMLEQEKLTADQYEAASKEVRTKLFEAAMDQTNKIMQIAREEAYKYCGKNCSQLAQFGLSINPQEKIADWYATETLPLFLEKIAPEHRAQASAMTMALFCENPEESGASTDLTASEKKYSLEVHPDSRNRRLSLYTPEVSALVKCENKNNETEEMICKP